MSCRRVLLPLLILLLIASASAQKASKPTVTFQLLSIQVKGASGLREDQVITASGLKIGQFAGEADLQRAIEKLGNTGMFKNLTYSYHYSSDGGDVEFQIAENPELVPLVFDNLVWFSDDELITLLRSRVPLFNGRLPVSGKLADEVADSLNALLSERKIAGKADYIRAGAMNGPIDSYIYKINFHPVLIRNFDFPGAAPAEVPALEEAGKQLSGKDYLHTNMRPQEMFSFLPVYLTRGYLQASFSDAQAKVVADGARTLVDVTLPVSPGRQYRLTGVQWQGNAVFPADKLQELVHLKTGQPADALQLASDVEAVKKLYGTKGYLFAQVDPTPTMDDAQSTVAYELNVTEGELYRMGELELDGLDPDVSKKIAAQWQMKKGDPYDNSYMQRFFSIMYRDVGIRHPYNVVPKQSINQQDKTVSVALHFMPKG